ncbi:type II toxin-antitoxin system PemK/MazF family toxin [Rhodococcus sp. BP-252]|uniref:type II toxin-antitoxin system PemK/MazF family toxin n=1 Tax=unclassified Rhodococcus (in: high G+C Gram-positive bacteria) TaxID=192944 RepID=UPI001C9BA219|nr:MULTISPECIES: type II toxin-antitoxin system PemK/MazF family toxin [unclassified Rhodococcus (in: high G+C Gram-positive bacteria)]MBY6411708.1 type II toxin-antitoxin system PemK/MazF family toxin [Rhodococcus sp. BP-320]MBY6417307.1 type II toxin-antitoxin system PemK/MazF family toxin [Rhodococcus sp. BP-321]MBY6421908.1 type II toxin-antitoxin system PemK/MazF family toxin [Rhodococcus sp. BP-324]MBY6427331.1 type II toxin-antitoxin system PemK/MazF family toxin [Rhodococcus sp. BP-323]
MNPGDLVLLWFPFNHSAAQPFKKRPALVLSRVGLGDDEAIVCVMVTGNPHRFRSAGAGDIKLTDWRSCGLAKESTIRSRRVWSAMPADFAGNIGRVKASTLEAVREEVRTLLGV